MKNLLVKKETGKVNKLLSNEIFNKNALRIIGEGVFYGTNIFYNLKTLGEMKKNLMFF